MMPETPFRIVRVVVFENLIPTMPKANSATSIVVFHKVGRALLPTWHCA